MYLWQVFKSTLWTGFLTLNGHIPVFLLMIWTLKNAFNVIYVVIVTETNSFRFYLEDNNHRLVKMVWVGQKFIKKNLSRDDKRGEMCFTVDRDREMTQLKYTEVHTVKSRVRGRIRIRYFLV